MKPNSSIHLAFQTSSSSHKPRNDTLVIESLIISIPPRYLTHFSFTSSGNVSNVFLFVDNSITAYELLIEYGWMVRVEKSERRVGRLIVVDGMY